MSVWTRLYRGESRINFIGHRKRWYLASLILILICVVSFVVRGFNYGVEFKGGSTFTFTGTQRLGQQRDQGVRGRG